MTTLDNCLLGFQADSKCMFLVYVFAEPRTTTNINFRLGIGWV